MDAWQPGSTPPSFDKQPVRDYLDGLHWDKSPPPPALPRDVVAATSARYIEAYERITGRSFADWPGVGRSADAVAEPAAPPDGGTPGDGRGPTAARSGPPHRPGTARRGGTCASTGAPMAWPPSPTAAVVVVVDVLRFTTRCRWRWAGAVVLPFPWGRGDAARLRRRPRRRAGRPARARCLVAVAHRPGQLPAAPASCCRRPTARRSRSPPATACPRPGAGRLPARAPWPRWRRRGWAGGRGGGRRALARRAGVAAPVGRGPAGRRCGAAGLVEAGRPGDGLPEARAAMAAFDVARRPGRLAGPVGLDSSPHRGRRRRRHRPSSTPRRSLPCSTGLRSPGGRGLRRRASTLTPCSSRYWSKPVCAEGVADPQGATIERSLPTRLRRGDGRAGRQVLSASPSTGDEATARAEVDDMCQRFLTNPVIEDARSASREQVPPVMPDGRRRRRLPRPNCELDVVEAVRCLGGEAGLLWHGDRQPRGRRRRLAGRVRPRRLPAPGRHRPLRRS